MAESALAAARERAAGMDPERQARAAGARFDAPGTDSAVGRFTIPFLGADVAIAYPDFELAYYLALSDGTQPRGEWTSLGELEGGTFYVTAFRGYTGVALARRFGQGVEELERRVEVLGGQPVEGLGDRAWRVPALPRVPIALAWWDADDEFDAAADLLFDVTALDHLPLDGCAVLGSWLTSMLTR
jgi:hypothetical protein